MPTLVVELVGPAGAGKTTLARHLSAPPRDRAVRADLSLWGLPRWSLVRSAIALVPTILTAALRGRPLRWAEVAQMIRLGALHREVRRASRRHPIVLLDEGPVFALSWLDVFFARNGRDRTFAAWRGRTLAAWAALLDLVVLLDASDPDLANRIRTRAKPHPVKDRPDAEICGFTAGFRRAFERVIGDLATLGGPAVDTLTTDDAASSRSAERLRATLERAFYGY